MPPVYAYPLLIKQLLHTPFSQSLDQEIVYGGQLRMTYSTLQERIARLEREGTIAGYTVRLADDAEAKKLRAVVMISADEYEGMLETLHLLRNPANAARLLQSISEANAGQLSEHGLIEPAPAEK